MVQLYKPGWVRKRISHSSLFFILILCIIIQYGATCGALRISRSMKLIGLSDSNQVKGSLKIEEGDDGGEKHFAVFHFDFEHTSGPIIIALWIFLSALATVSFHMMPGIRTVFPESCFLIVLGIIIGFIFFLSSDQIVSTFTPSMSA